MKPLLRVARRLCRHNRKCLVHFIIRPFLRFFVVVNSSPLFTWDAFSPFNNPFPRLIYTSFHFSIFDTCILEESLIFCIILAALIIVIVVIPAIHAASAFVVLPICFYRLSIPIVIIIRLVLLMPILISVSIMLSTLNVTSVVMIAVMAMILVTFFEFHSRCTCKFAVTR